jgi:6-phosphogluconolactonase
VELVFAQANEMRTRLTSAFEEWVRLRQGSGEAGRNQSSCALSGGATALFFLGALRAAKVDWRRISLFWADERAVPADDPESNYGIADRLLLGPLGAKAPRTFRMAFDFAQARPAEAVLRGAALYYDDVLARELRGGPLDLALLGIGEDGHIASLFPGHRALISDDRVVAIEDAPKPPQRRLSLTLPFLIQTKNIWVIALGPRKLPVLHAAMGKMQRNTPLDLLMQQAKNVTVFTDQVIHRN